MLLLIIIDIYLMYFFSGLVPLHNACSYGHYDVTELLIKVIEEYFCSNLW